jgi:hypothetical protein
VRAEVRTVFEEVVWGVEHVNRRLESLQKTGSAVMVKALHREIDEQQQWLMGRLEVLHGLLNRLSE